MVQKGHFMIVKRAPDEFISLKLKEYISQWRLGAKLWAIPKGGTSKICMLVMVDRSDRILGEKSDRWSLVYGKSIFLKKAIFIIGCDEYSKLAFLD